MDIDLDRAAGALLGLAAGDALGAGYEFTHPDEDTPITLDGGRRRMWEPGEWTDDTQMAICIAQVTADRGMDVPAIGDAFLSWYRAGQKDVGTQTSKVLFAAPSGDILASVAEEYAERHQTRSAGNGSLMRTAPVALACLGDDGAIAHAARMVSALTHGDHLAGEACVLWCVAIDCGVRHGRIDGVHDGIALLPPERGAWWAACLEEAQA